MFRKNYRGDFLMGRDTFGLLDHTFINIFLFLLTHGSSYGKR